ncbi:MAG TPA: hypothetical protein VF075_13025 [Pyrinomonadaceae bacterium]
MKNFLFLAGAVALLALLVSFPIRRAHGQDGLAEVSATTTDFVEPIVFQAAGPSVDSIRSAVVEYQHAFPGDLNGSKGPQGDGRREINWDGGNPAIVTTALTGNPFDGFKNSRGALFTTPDGTGFVQATPSGLAGATVFNNPTYATIFKPFSDSRLFGVIGGTITDVDFFVPAGGGPATTSGFGAVFSDVDKPDGSGPGEKRGNRKASTLIEYFGVNGELLFSSFVPAAPGDRGQSFFGIKFADSRIAKVRITTGNVAGGPDDGGKLDVVMMDDFIYGEPKAALP